MLSRKGFVHIPADYALEVTAFFAHHVPMASEPAERHKQRLELPP